MTIHDDPLRNRPMKVVPGVIMASTRDASFYRNAGRSSGSIKYHIISDGWLSACKSVLLNENEIDARRVPLILRCQRKGCREAWPEVADLEARQGKLELGK